MNVVYNDTHLLDQRPETSVTVAYNCLILEGSSIISVFMLCFVDRCDIALMRRRGTIYAEMRRTYIMRRVLFDNRLAIGHAAEYQGLRDTILHFEQSLRTPTDSVR